METDELFKHMRSRKKTMVRQIMKKVKPLMWESGYCRGISTPGYIWLCVFPDNKYYRPKGLLTVADAGNNESGFGGFTDEDCIVTDSYGGGLVTQSLHGLCFEDVARIHRWVMNDPYGALRKLKEKQR